MVAVRIAAAVFGILVAGSVAFQLALALGAPWGEYAMGGRFPGAFPPAMRVAAAVQAGILVALGLIAAARAGVAVQSWSSASGWLIWVVVGFSALSLLVNSISPSRPERRLWAPVALGLLVTSLVVALGG